MHTPCCVQRCSARLSLCMSGQQRCRHHQCGPPAQARFAAGKRRTRCIARAGAVYVGLLWVCEVSAGAPAEPPIAHFAEDRAETTGFAKKRGLCKGAARCCHFVCLASRHQCGPPAPARFAANRTVQQRRIRLVLWREVSARDAAAGGPPAQAHFAAGTNTT